MIYCDRTPKEYKKYTQEQIDRADQTDLYELAKYRGYEVRDKSHKLAEIRHQGGLDINRNKNTWYCHSAQTGGGPIQLLIYMEGLSWLEAVQNILNEEGAYEVFIPNQEQDREKETKENFQLPEKNTTYKHVFAYLVKTRKIHPDIVNEFVKNKLLYENDKKSCMFVGKDTEGKPRYAAIRGTNTVGTSFKGEAAQSDKRYGFARPGKNGVLTIFEAPIDVLSYMTIYKIHGLEKMIQDEHLLSLGGVSDIALEQYLYDHPEVTKIKMGLDQDEAGIEGCNKIAEKYADRYAVERIHMKEKDFNEVLIQDINRILAKQEIKRMQEQQLEQEELEAAI
ncbi:DUF3991 domain-containing protein [Anaeromicropila populeti]|uniref:Toprim-like n=1 Tax=Anaeromicropila populeti TaxID=37658 RepID=A0A1I6JEE9_9FIRM|nr:DUF3991 domain-containing protein [Anaeromicropila populeti]SFR77336.1 Toprim-like [Anaeromicropila populeti]